ncbi:MAG: 1,4-dihydroxy-6-naphthoate synthase [Deltaproteobacteria bacterium RIFOXYD12_FULL_57_12]|nr:MAG: 1,4-dihydroxy-6-naphthoate synthase [Deltaproteobacteria bacterium RIFOXYD12_FULL_57_12]
MNNRCLTIGYSPCPNDTYIFYGLAHGKVRGNGWTPAPEILADVETLNSWALAGRLDITKLSFHALGHVLDDYVLLRAGAALGHGCGPLLVAGHRMDSVDLQHKTIAVPGRLTTAAMLLRLYAPECRQTVAMRFDEIMPSIKAGKVDAGVIIHESRFTFAQHGLVQLRDLGAWWEECSGHPIPLGGIAVRRSLGSALIGQVEEAVRASVRWAAAQPAACMGYVRQHAQEMDDQVMREHIALYVNHYSEELGTDGLAAVRFFLQKGREVGVLPPARPQTALCLDEDSCCA